MSARLLFLLLVACAVPVRALPLLQLDVSQGFYSEPTESTVATTNAFTLYALLDSTNTSGTYYISAAIQPAPAGAADLGSFVFNGQTVHATADMTWGSPALLPGHGVYPTWYKEFAFNFQSTLKTTNYNVQDVTGPHTGPLASATGTSLYRAFDVDLSGLTNGTTLVFDLYSYDVPTTTTTGSGKAKKVKATTGFAFAPFSHNAEGTSTTTTNNVPEAGTTAAFLLLGAAATALGHRRFRSRKS